MKYKSFKILLLISALALITGCSNVETENATKNIDNITTQDTNDNESEIDTDDEDLQSQVSDNEATDTDISANDTTINEGEVFGKFNPITEEINNYTDDEICKMALNYYEKRNDYTPGFSQIESGDNETVTIHLFDDMGDHIATCDWYTVNKRTLVGTNTLEEEICLLDTDPEEVINKSNYRMTPLFTKDNIPYEGYEYKWNEITITLPNNWKDLIVIEDNENGFSIYQKASYDKEKGMGNIFTIYKTVAPTYVNMGDMLAYSPDYAYYIIYPSDVCYDFEDKNITNEYIKLHDETNMVSYSLSIDDEYVNYLASEYALPMSEYRVYDEDLLDILDEKSIKLGASEICMKKGCLLGDNADYYLQSSRLWPSEDLAETNIDSNLSYADKKNLYNITHVNRNTYTLIENKYNEVNEAPNTLNKIYKEFTYYKLDDNSEKPVVKIDGTEFDIYDTSKWGIEFCDMANESYILDMDPYDEAIEIAILDNGLSDDYVTYFFSYENGDLTYIGQIESNCLNNSHVFSGLTETGHAINGEIRSDILDTNYVYMYYYYNSSEKKFEYYEEDEFDFVIANDYTLLEDLPIYMQANTDSVTYNVSKGENIKVVSTDLSSWIKVKTKDGILGYVFIDKNGTDGKKVLNNNMSIDDVFDGLCYFD